MNYDDALSDEDREIIKQYEEVVAQGRSDYFDVDDMEMIIEHYLFDEKGDDLKKAEQALEYAFKLHPGDSNLYCQKAAIYLAQNKPKKALDLLDRYRDHDDNVHTFNHAEALCRVRRRDEGVAEFKQLVENVAADDDYNVPALCNDILRVLTDYIDLEDGEDAPSKKAFKDTLYFYDKILALDPNNTDTMNAKAATLDIIGQRDEAIALCNRSIDLNPYNVDTWHQLCTIHSCANQYAEALNDCNYALAIDPNDLQALGDKADCEYNLQDFENCIATLKKYLKLDKDDGCMWYLMARCYEQQQDPENARKAYKRVVAIVPEDDSSWFGIAEASLYLHDTKEMKRSIKKALALRPEYPSYLLMWANVLHDEKKIEECEAMLQHILKDLKPDFAAAWKLYGDLALDCDDSIKAQSYYEKAIELCKEQEIDIFDIYFFACIAAYSNEDYEKAQEYFDIAKERNSFTPMLVQRIFKDAKKHLKL